MRRVPWWVPAVRTYVAFYIELTVLRFPSTALDLDVRSDIVRATSEGEYKPLVWLAGEVKSPPFSTAARIRAGYLLRKLQAGERLSMPDLRPMSSLGSGCCELRIRDGDRSWRIMVRIDSDAVVIAEVFAKKTRTTPRRVLEACRRRWAQYDQDAR